MSTPLSRPASESLYAPHANHSVRPALFVSGLDSATDSFWAGLANQVEKTEAAGPWMDSMATHSSDGCATWSLGAGYRDGEVEINLNTSASWAGSASLHNTAAADAAVDAHDHDESILGSMIAQTPVVEPSQAEDAAVEAAALQPLRVPSPPGDDSSQAAGSSSKPQVEAEIQHNDAAIEQAGVDTETEGGDRVTSPTSDMGDQPRETTPTASGCQRSHHSTLFKMNTNQQAGNTSAPNDIWDGLELNQTDCSRPPVVNMAVLDQAAESNNVANCETDESNTMDGDNGHDVEIVDDDRGSPSRVSAGTLDDTTLVGDNSPTPGPSTLGQPEGPSMLKLFRMLQRDGDQDALPVPSEATGAPAERLRLPELDTEVQYDGESGEDVEMARDEYCSASCLSQAGEGYSVSHDPAAQVDDAETEAHVASPTPGPSGTSSNSYTSHSAAAQEPDASPTPGPSSTSDAEFWERVSTPKVNKTKEYEVLFALDDEELLAVVPYGNGFCRRPLLERASATTLYKLATKTGWSAIKTGKRVTVDHMVRLRGDAVRDADMLAPRMVGGTAEGNALATIRAIVLSRLDTLIAARTGQAARLLAADAQDPNDEKVMTALRRAVHDNDWISCVWCGEQRCALKDKGYVGEHLKYSEHELQPHRTRYNCPVFAGY
ncbi:hypothetical protein AURDEDRAFT_160247 [Auricularia subglabra TFB-10046 SS5]|nr:hypothetical protein AURDEDRAFT_160247 [Auricularia subglabra TFB-10046 SS5]